MSFFMILLFGIQAWQEFSATVIVKKSDDNVCEKTSVAVIIIKIICPKCTSDKIMRAWSKGDAYSMVLATSPAKKKGTLFLNHRKEVWT